MRPIRARLAWCYGDPGIAAALLVAARAVGSSTWEAAAVRIGLRAAARREDQSGVVDTGLCHGAAGLGHIFNRLYRTTKHRRFAAAARTWFARALAMRDPQRGFEGFFSRMPDRRGRFTRRRDVGFLNGAAGVALALLAATTDADPVWDRALLLS